MVSTALQIAQSGLATQQRKMELAGNHIAKAGDPNAMKTVGYELSHVLGNQSKGVTFSQTARILPVEDYLLVNNRTLTQKSSYHETLVNGLKALDSTLNRLDDYGNLSYLYQDFINACAELSRVPSSYESQSVVMKKLERITTFLNEASDNNLNRRRDAELSIERAVDYINLRLDYIAELNLDIKSCGGVNTADYETQRDTMMKELSTYIDFTVQKEQYGGLSLFTKSFRVFCRLANNCSF